MKHEELNNVAIRQLALAMQEQNKALMLMADLIVIDDFRRKADAGIKMLEAFRSSDDHARNAIRVALGKEMI